jgi:hypothetical protein
MRYLLDPHLFEAQSGFEALPSGDKDHKKQIKKNHKYGRFDLVVPDLFFSFNLPFANLNSSYYKLNFHFGNSLA